MSTFEKHPHFDLWLHSTESLAHAIGQQITGRETIHEWPLSSVQKITCHDGNTLIYKTQTLATVEPEFYRVAQSALLPAYQYLGETNGVHTMLFEYIKGEKVDDIPLDVSHVLVLGQRIQHEITCIAGTLPAYTDIGSREKWLAFAEKTLKILAALIHNGSYTVLQPKMVALLREWANAPRLLELVETTSTFTHGDLNGGNIFLVGDDLCLIDWQRPHVAPVDVDMAALLYSKDFDAYAHVRQEAVQMYHFLRIGWFVECQTSYFPQGIGYEQQIIEATSSIFDG